MKGLTDSASFCHSISQEGTRVKKCRGASATSDSRSRESSAMALNRIEE